MVRILLLVGFVFWLFSAFAHAQTSGTVTTVNILLVPLTSYDGKVMPDTGEPADARADGHSIACMGNKWCPPLTLRVLAVNVLTATFCADPRAPCPAALTKERDISAGQKIARADLARRIWLHPEAVQLDTAERALLERLIGAVYPGPILADVVPMLDPAEKPEAVQP